MNRNDTGRPGTQEQAEGLAADIATLRRDFPAWHFASTWVTGGTRDRRVILAYRGPAILAAFTEAGMRAVIRGHEAGVL